MWRLSRQIAQPSIVAGAAGVGMVQFRAFRRPAGEMGLAREGSAREAGFGRVIAGLAGREMRLMLLREAGMLCAYALAFWLMWNWAAGWAYGAYYSVWFPAAGLRLAYLWRRPLGVVPFVCLAEIAGNWLAGNLQWMHEVQTGGIRIYGPCLMYGLVVNAARDFRRAPSEGTDLSPLRFAVATVLAPLLASLMAMINEFGHAPLTRVAGLIADFLLGDLLGVLVVAPPLLWLADRVTGARPWAIERPKMAQVAEFAALMVMGWGGVLGLYLAGLGLALLPVLVATCWLALRLGILAAWLSILIAAMVVLPLSAGHVTASLAFQLHVALTRIAVAGYMAGSFTEAERHARREIARRDRLLLRAERLKTLRAISLAIIHEISQPLSTLAIEARHLAELGEKEAASPETTRQVAGVISRKADDLAHLVERLRRFGELDPVDAGPVDVGRLIADVVAIARAEAQEHEVSIEVAGSTRAVVSGHAIELRQALLNLVRNAVAAAPPGGQVHVAQQFHARRLTIAITNPVARKRRRPAGMGIGLIIARTIAEAHGGEIERFDAGADAVTYGLTLPLGGAQS
ncbi:MAG TPA: HAMP domain-containing sensor histidine kinase [Novosphingobium sp.]|nr:HAMP domain-containing sensor histidine kinase [Novosphingobium sp.]